MKNSDKYLGDQLHKTAKRKVTIEYRVAKGHGIVNEIVAILSDIPLGLYRDWLTASPSNVLKWGPLQQRGVAQRC